MIERLAIAAAAELDDFVRAFEAVWARDGQADLSDFLPAPTHPLRCNVLRELVRVDLELRWHAGRPLPLADYRRRFPDLFAEPRAVAELAYEEYRLRRQAGLPVTAAEYRVAFGVDVSSWPQEEANSGLAGPHRAFASEGDRAHLPDHFQPSGAPDSDSWEDSSLRGSPEGATGSATTDPVLAQLLARALPALPPDGTRFLGFRLLMELGRGAFGRVYLAQQGDLANRPVALKISVDLFRESQHLARLQHTHIVPIYSVHRAGPFQAVCMPYFGATTLADVLRAWSGQKLPESGRALVQTLRVRQDAIAAREAAPKETRQSGEVSATLRTLEGLSLVQAVLWMAVRLADGLAHAHERGILHRDLKPANVLLTDDGQPMLLDFNLSADTQLLVRASAAQVGGTLPYMAPEHLQAFRGGGGIVDARCDLYSLGVILYELLTGHLPFPAHTGALDDVLAASIVDRLQPPPWARAWNRAIAPALEAILRKLLAPRPADRYPSAQALREDLQRQLDNQPLRYAPEPSLRERITKWVRRHPRLASPATVGALLVALTAALLAWHAWQKYHGTSQKLDTTQEERDSFRLQAEDKQRRVEEQQRQLKEHQRQAEEQQRQLHGKLDSLQWHETEALPLGRLADAVAFDDSQKDAYSAHCLTALSHYRVLEGPRWLEQPEVELLPDARREARRDVGELLYLLARTTLQDTADEASLPGNPCRFGLALPAPAVLALDAVAAVVRVRQQQARQWNEWARNCYRQGKTPPALLLQQALLARLDGEDAQGQRLLRQVKKTKPQNARACYLLAYERAALGEYELALPLARAARVANSSTWATWYLEGICQARLGHAKEAIACFDVCLALKGSWAPAHFQRGRAHLEREHWQQARDDFDRVLAANRRQVTVYTWRARALTGLRQYREALADWDRFLAARPGSLRGHLRRADLYRVLGNRDAARRDLAFVRAAQPTTAADFTLRGLARAAEDGEGALADYRRALELEPDYLPALENQAALLAERGEGAAALGLLDRVLRLAPRSVSTRLQRGLLRAQIGQRAGAHEDVEASLAGDLAPALLYEAACVHAQTSAHHASDREQALKLLTRAVEQGYDGSALAADKRLAPLHNDPCFRRLVMAAQVFTPRPQ